jgi:rhodanese-related sulfurtransferase
MGPVLNLQGITDQLSRADGHRRRSLLFGEASAAASAGRKLMRPRRFIFTRGLTSIIVIVVCLAGTVSLAFAAKTRSIIYDATLEAPGQKTPEVSTDEFRAILTKKNGIVFDARPKEEYAIAHIPGSISLDEKGMLRIAQLFPDPDTAMVLYSNGPFCPWAKRRAEELARLGYSKVSRYQLGLPVWRALGGTVETTLQGVRRIVYENNAVVVDARSRGEYASGSIPAAETILAGEVRKAKEDRRLRYYDHNAQIIVFANSAKEARTVAEELAENAYPNSSYFGGSYNDLKRAKFFLERKPSPSYLDGLRP